MQLDTVLRSDNTYSSRKLPEYHTYFEQVLSLPLVIIVIICSTILNQWSSPIILDKPDPSWSDEGRPRRTL